MMSLRFFLGLGRVAKERARWIPGASCFGPRFNLSLHRAQAATSVLPVRTRFTATLTAPHSSHSPMPLLLRLRSLNPLDGVTPHE